MYFIWTGYDSFFRINSTTGMVTLLRALDYETTELYLLDVVARDADDNTATTTLTVRVKNINDVPPQWVEDTPTFYISSEYTPGAVIGIVRATDPEQGSNSIEYSILPTNDFFLFSVHPSTGAVTSPTQFVDGVSSTSFELDVVAQDNGSPSLTSTTLRVQVWGHRAENPCEE